MRTFDSADLDCSAHDAVMAAFDDYEDAVDPIELHAREAVRSAYLCEKPLTEVELSDKPDRATVEAFADAMNEWFYTYVREVETTLEGEPITVYSVYLSRFQGVISIVNEFVDREQPMPADVRGILFGYDATDVAGYCDEQAPNLLR